MYPVKTIEVRWCYDCRRYFLRGKISLGGENCYSKTYVNNNRVPINSLIPSKVKRCGDNDDSDRFSELTDLEEWTNPNLPKMPPRELNGLSNYYSA